MPKDQKKKRPGLTKRDIELKRLQVENFNLKVRVGDPVNVTDDFGVVTERTLTSPAVLLNDLIPVVWVSGITGCYALEKVAPVNV